MADDDPSTLRMTRALSADRETVWRAWTEDLARWFWPERFGTRVELEPRSVAAYRIWSPTVGMGVGGVVEEADPSRRLVLTWRWEGEDAQTRVTVLLTGGPGGTELELRHEGHTSAQQRADHVEGWDHCLGRLAEWVSNEEPPGSGG